MQCNAHTKHLHLDACIHCDHGAAGALCVQPLQGHTGTRKVVSDKASKLSTQTQKCKTLQVIIKTNKGMQYHLIMMVLAEYSSSHSLSYDVGNIILTLLKLSNISKLLCSSLTLAPQCPAFT